MEITKEIFLYLFSKIKKNTDTKLINKIKYKEINLEKNIKKIKINKNIYK